MTEKQYKLKLIQLFYNSVDRDIDKWTDNGSKKYISCEYNNELEFVIDIYDTRSYLILRTNNEELIISKYKKFFIPVNLKLYKYQKKLMKHFKLKEQNQQNEKVNQLLISSIDTLSKSFVKEVRKDKLSNLNKNNN